MKKLTKFCAVTLFALFVTACGKADPKADFKTLTEWAESNRPSISAAQQELLAATPATIESAVNNFKAKVSESKKSLEALKIDSPEIKVLKEKMELNLTLSNELITDALQATLHPDQIDQKALDEKTQHVQQTTRDLQKLQAELQQKFGEQAK